MVQEADVVLAIGTELGETDYDINFDDGFRISGQLIRIDIDSQQLTRNARASLAMVADAKAALIALLAVLRRRANGRAVKEDWGIARAARVRTAVAASLDPGGRAQKIMLDTVRCALPEVIIVGDSTQPVYVGNLVYEAPSPRSWFNSSTGYGTLGYGLPAAIGAKLAVGNRAVVCLIGDGGLQFTLAELASAVEAGLAVIVLVWNNSGYGEIKKHMQDCGIRSLGVDIYTPDFMILARGFGCVSERVRTVKELKDQLGYAASRTIPTVLEIDAKTWIESQGQAS